MLLTIKQGEYTENLSRTKKCHDNRHQFILFSMDKVHIAYLEKRKKVLSMCHDMLEMIEYSA